MIKKIISIILSFFFALPCIASINSNLYLDNAINKIDAEKNAYLHNDMGLLYLKEGYYYGAIKEFKLAIDLNPNKQTTAVYYANLGRVYMKIGYPALAQTCFESSLEQNPMDFSTYQNLVKAYKRQGILATKLTKYKKSKNPLSKIMVGLILVESGKKINGLTMLDNFCYEEPDLIITHAVRNYIKSFD